jgi:hypothetical protein
MQWNETRMGMAAHLQNQRPVAMYRMPAWKPQVTIPAIDRQGGRILMAGENHVPAGSKVQRIKLKELRARRKPLFEWYEKNPGETRLVLEIKKIDDEIAECNAQIERERKGQG